MSHRLRLFDILYNYILMFQNCYQNGTYFQLFDPKFPQDRVKNLFRLNVAPNNPKIFDRDLKTYVYEFMNHSAKICFPKDDKQDLYLIQPFLTLQIFLPKELIVSDLNKVTDCDVTQTKRRIIFSSTGQKLEQKPFFIKYPCQFVKEGMWIDFVVDMYSFMHAFKDEAYRCLDSIQISGHFKLRRIFTSQDPPLSAGQEESEIKTVNLLPKNFQYPHKIRKSTHIIAYKRDSEISDQGYLITEQTLREGQAQQNSTTSIGYNRERKFLASTGGIEQIRNKKQESPGEIESDKCILTKTAKKKNVSKPKELRNSNMPKNKSNIEAQKGQSRNQSLTKKTIDRTQGRVTGEKNTRQVQQHPRQARDSNKVVRSDMKCAKGKMNPWKSQKAGPKTNEGTLKQIDERKIETAETTLFKTKNNLQTRFNQSKNTGFEHRSDNYSDSEYFEKSQRFSTVTECRFFQNQLTGPQSSQNQDPGHNQNEEIEENIEVQTNSVSSRLNAAEQCLDAAINESIHETIECDKKQEPDQKKDSIFLSSLYGFGVKAMNRLMDKIERPYSPPLGERSVTEGDEYMEQGNGQKEVELIYDPVLKCYYDHKTHTYYELKK